MLNGGDMSKSYSVRLWIRIACGTLPIVAAMLLLEERSLVVLLCMLLLGLCLFYVASIQVVVNNQKFQARLIYSNTLLRRISFNDIISIDAKKIMGVVVFNIRLNSNASKNWPLYGWEDNLLVGIELNNRIDLIEYILKKNPQVLVDKLTSSYLGKKRGVVATGK
jgi:hypothetical protein